MAKNVQGPKNVCSRWLAANQPDTTQWLKTGDPHSSEQQQGMLLQVWTFSATMASCVPATWFACAYTLGAGARRSWEAAHTTSDQATAT